MKRQEIRIFARITPKEKERINSLAKQCGLTTNEYLRQRALGYAPHAVPSNVLFRFCEKLDALIDPPFSSEVNKEAITLLKEITKEIILPRKEDTRKWQPQVFGPSKED